MDSIVHGILQARILEWVAFPFFRDLPNPGIEPGSPASQVILYPLSCRGSPHFWQKPLQWLFLCHMFLGALKRTEFSRVLLSAWDPDTGVI